MSDGGDGVFERTKQKQKSFNLLLYFLRHHKRFRFHRRMQLDPGSWDGVSKIGANIGLDLIELGSEPAWENGERINISSPAS